ncbi:MAG TPA: DNRLRE domain-containing protein [Candidatus Paceibacterota bacterium]|nr:DNRLRE domain-containing protein [Candidatus Paceibacterota bacterium]
MRCYSSITALFLVLSALTASPWMPGAGAGTVVIQPNTLGATPRLLAYNSGHFYPGSNTREWWRYAGVSGARVFLTATLIENVDDIAGRGDGVTDEASFLARRAALRADPLNPAFINWANFTNRYNTAAQHGANRLQPEYAFAELRRLGVEIDLNLTASLGSFVISNSADWAGKWELWQHYYAQAFYLARAFEVRRFQMFNEPDHSSAGGLTQAQYLERLQLCSDAIQCALADVNTLYGRSLVPMVLAPVITTSSYNSWGQLVVNNRHVDFLGQTDPAFWLLHQYDYHQYNATPATFGLNLATLRNALAAAMTPEPVFPASISEFNVHTAANFDAMPDTLDYPTKYPRLGAIAVNLIQNGASELYCFKFSQTDGDADDVYPVRKNGMHYVDNSAAPYNIGGITKAGEVWRLLNKGFSPGRALQALAADSSLSHLALLASHDPATARYHVFSANFSTTAAPVTVDVSALNIPDDNRVLIEEVSESSHGGVAHFTRVLAGRVETFTQPTGSVWLVTLPAKPQHLSAAGDPRFSCPATDDATVRDGANRHLNFGAESLLVVRNDPADVSNRSAALLKFRLPAVYLPDVQLAVLTVSGATLATNATVQAHVYGLTNNGWWQTNVTWATAPSLLQNVPAGNRIAHQFVHGLGDSAFIQGQLVFTSTQFAERQIDVTPFVRGATNHEVSFLIAQEPRWNLTLPSLTPGDTQPDGLRIAASEAGANGPRLLLARLRDSDDDGLSDEAETTVFGTDPNRADTDGDGVSDGEEVLIYFTNPTNTLPWVVVPPLLYEPFAYPAGSVLAGQGGWLLNGGTSGVVEAGNLEAPGLQAPADNRLTWSNASMSLRLPLGTNLSAGELFFSFVLRVDQLGNAFTTDGTLAGLTTGTGTLFGAKINIRTNGAGGFNLGLSKAGGTTYGAWATNDFAVGQSLFVVGRYQFNGETGTEDICDLWLNPEIAAFGAAAAPRPAVAGVGGGGSDLPQIDRFFFRSGGSSASPAKLTVDELRVGPAWSSVTPVAPPRLDIALSNDAVTLMWPTNPPGFNLETTAGLQPASWVSVTNTARNGTGATATFGATNSARFFRLRR